MVCSPAEEIDGDGRILKRGDRRWSSGRPNRQRPGHQGARVSSARGRGEVGYHEEVLIEVGMQGGGRIPATIEGRRGGQASRVAARVEMGRGCGSTGECKGATARAPGRFYRARMARGGRRPE
jgi:hypothetical protein